MESVIDNDIVLVLESLLLEVAENSENGADLDKKIKGKARKLILEMRDQVRSSIEGKSNFPPYAC